MAMLSPHIAHDPAESVMGFVARLAAFHIGGRTGSFLSDNGIKPPELARGDSDAVHRLADWTGVSPDALFANAPRGLDRRHYDLRGEHVSAEFLASPYTVFCPACLLEDDQASGGQTGERRHQWIWQLAVVRTCPSHGLPLMRRKADFSGDRFHELGVIVPETGERLADMIGQLQPRSVSPLQNYTLARLEGETGPAWLDSEGLEQAVRASEMLGALVLFGARPNLDNLTEDDWDRAGAAGYAITAQGEDGIRRVLADIHARANRKGGKLGPQAVFGRLYQWLSRSRAKKEPGDIKRILRDYIVENIEMPAGKTVLGKTLAERRLHTCATLAKESGLDPRTLRNVLEAKAVIPLNAARDANYVFDADLGREVSQTVRRLVPISGLPKLLGCTRPLAEQLVAERILTPIVDEVSDAPGRKKKAVDEKEAEELLRRITAFTKPVEKIPGGMVDLAKAAMKSNAPAVEIVHLILGGHLQKVVRAVGFDGCDAIHLDPIEAKAVVSDVMGGLSPSEAFIRMGIPVASGWELVRRGLLRACEIRSEDGEHVIHRFEPEVVDAFLSEFTTEVHIGAALGMGVRDLKPVMKAAGAKPFLLKSDIGVRIFRRSDLPDRFRV
ncbi:TniQ family protein [Paracoccus seriniphilus]|uniref:TniQ protein n=1 Tax=Paracoccus seriniphilus TaxID=184748 RepID=A0A239Q3L9_9RHOB|nr:TniQ family protein [Paracoccus seriniphilus]SNT76813.1 TniQ protein [Paracoccus seriniphilus]